MAIYKRNIKQASKGTAASTGNMLTREEELQALLRMCSPEEFSHFIADYSKEQPGVHEALQDFILPSKKSKGYPDYNKQVNRLFDNAIKALDYHEITPTLI